MNQEKFVEILKVQVTSSSVNGAVRTLTKPAGRKPADNLIQLSEFYNSLNSEQKDQINKIIKLAVDSSVFSFLCILDGVSSINTPEESGGALKLIYVDEKSEVLLNSDEGDYLHDIYNAE